MSEKFTPGSWVSRPLVDGAEVYADSGAPIADVFCGDAFIKGHYHVSGAECHANAALIATAPDMYKALKELTGAWRGGYEWTGLDVHSAIRMADAALEKARGES